MLLKMKYLSKEAFRKIIYKQYMWRVYKHTRKAKDNEVYVVTSFSYLGHIICNSIR